ncbi:MAG: hypothetical protein ABSG33_08385 [Candidatus Bathyarchaeia archaeon]|jgi:hypothetical protein
MPCRPKHEEFDRFLAKKSVLLPDGQYGEVHTFMDQGVETFGRKHRELDEYHKERGLRRWLNGKYNVIGQYRATDWLRAGLGHICLDEKESFLNEDYSWADVFDSAYRLMAQRKWTKARFISR